jgi:predicted nucleic acid-binding protein
VRVKAAQLNPSDEPCSVTDDQTYMLDTNVFNDLLDQKVSASLFARTHVIGTGIQASELKATSDDERRASLLGVFREVAPVPALTSSFAFDIEGAGFDQACWNDGTGQFQKMLARLETLDQRKNRSANQTRDILIAETAIKNGAILISGDSNLRQVVSEFGGRAISLEEFQSSKA